MNTASSVELNGRTNWKVFYMPEASQRCAQFFSAEDQHQSFDECIQQS